MKTILKVMMLSGCLFVNMLMQGEGSPFYYRVPASGFEYLGKGLAYCGGKVADFVLYFPKLEAECTRGFTKGVFGQPTTGYVAQGTFSLGAYVGARYLTSYLMKGMVQVLPFVRSVRNEFEHGVVSGNPYKIEESKNKKAIWFTENIDTAQKQQAVKDLESLKTRAAFKPLHVLGIAELIEKSINDEENSAIHFEKDFEDKVKRVSTAILKSYTGYMLWFVGFDKAAKEAIDLYVRICLKLYELDKKP